MPVRCLIGFCVVVACASGVRAQPSGDFGRLAVSVGGVENSNRGDMHVRWRPSTGAAIRIATAFHAGELDGGIRYVPMTARSPDVPSYSALLLHAGWGPAWRPGTALQISAGARLGVLRMRFDEDTFVGVATENELTMGGYARLDVAPLGRVGLYVEASAERTFTARPIDWVHVSAGMTWRLATPKWLRSVLE